MSEVTRRAFLAGVAGVTGGLVVGCRGSGPSQAPPGLDGAASFGAFIHVTPEGRVVVLVDKVEMGQGTHTGFATLVGEELELDPASIEVRHAGVDERFDPSGIQATGGSRSMVDRFTPLREAAARARILLEEAAAERLSVPAKEVRAEDGRVLHEATGRSLAFGELASDAARRSPPESVALKPSSAFRFIGKERPRIDGAAKSRGEALYGIDARVPGLLRAVVVHPPHPEDEILGYDAEAARKIPGVRHVIRIPTGVAIVADGYWPARKAAGVLALETAPGSRSSVSSDDIRAAQRALLRGGSDGKEVREEGDLETARAASAPMLEVEYFTSHQSHAAMEPMNCTVVPSAEGRVDVYVGTQAPGVVRDVVADVMGCARENVTIHTLLLGGGFGRRVFPDVAYEAALIARSVAAPVQLVYSREDDMARDYYRPATAHRLRGKLDASGRPLLWEHRMVAPPMMAYMAPRMAGALGPEWMRGILNGVGSFLARHSARFTGPAMAHEGAADVPYAVPSLRVESLAHDPGIQVGIWRSVGHSNNGFVVESFIDELAVTADRDPLAFRRELLGEHPRHLACLDLVAERSGWRAGSRSQGIAIHESFDTVVAQVADVEVLEREIRVRRVVCAVHCGLAINPDVVRAQIESGVIFGLTAALKGQITFRDGVAIERNFDRFPMLRMHEAPEIEVHIVPSQDPPTGVGEPGTPPIAAAVGNAVFAATGVRLREIPLRLPS